MVILGVLQFVWLARAIYYSYMDRKMMKLAREQEMEDMFFFMPSKKQRSIYEVMRIGFLREEPKPEKEKGGKRGKRSKGEKKEE